MQGIGEREKKKEEHFLQYIINVSWAQKCAKLNNPMSSPPFSIHICSLFIYCNGTTLLAQWGVLTLRVVTKKCSAVWQKNWPHTVLNAMQHYPKTACSVQVQIQVRIPCNTICIPLLFYCFVCHTKLLPRRSKMKGANSCSDLASGKPSNW